MTRDDLCVTEELLGRFLVGQVSDAELTELDAHFSSCEKCLRKAEQISSQDTLTNALKTADTAQVMPGPEQRERMQRTAESVISALAARQVETETVISDAKGSDDTEFAFLEPAEGSEELGRINGYRILKVIGKGGMGLVLEAEDVQLHRSLAIKIIKPEIASDSFIRERFLREARAAAALKHDHIVTVYQVGECNGALYIAMELLEGESLRSRLERETRLSAEETIRIAREMLSGLAAAHERGLTHRDIKPDNIWLEKDTGRVKLLDFGLATSAQEQGTLTQTGAVVGTPQYLAPEQIEDGPVDHRADLFSTGVVAYQMLTGESPFARKTLLTTLKAVETYTPQGLESFGGRDVSQLSDVVMKLLEKDPDQRLESAAVAVSRLDEISSQDQSPQTTTISPSFAESRREHRRMASLLIAGGLVTALLAAMIITFDTPDGEWKLTVYDQDVRVVVTQDGESVKDLEVKAGQPGIIDLSIGQYDVEIRGAKGDVLMSDGRVEIKRDGKVVAQLRKIESPQRVVDKDDQPEPAKVVAAETTAPLSPLALTATPTKVNGVKSWSLETGLHRGSIYLLQPSHDGKHLATVGYDRTIRIWRTEDFAPVQVLYLDPPQEGVFAIAWSRDGDHLACVGDQQATVFDIASGDPLHRIDNPSERGSKLRGSDVAWSKSGLLLIGYGYPWPHLVVFDVANGHVLRRDVAGGPPVCWEGDTDHIRKLNRENDEWTLVSWDVRKNREKFVARCDERDDTPLTYSNDFSRFIFHDGEKSQWLVKSREDDELLCSIPWPKEQPQNAYLTWSPDGKFVSYYDLEKASVRIVNVTTGKETPTSGVSAGDTTTWSSDSKHFYFYSRYDHLTREEPDVQIVDIQEGGIRRARLVHNTVRETAYGPQRFSGPHALNQVVWSPDGKRFVTVRKGRWDIWDADSGRLIDTIEIDNTYLTVHGWPESDTITGSGGSHGDRTWSYSLRTRLFKPSESHGVPIAATADGKQVVFVDSKDRHRVRIVDALQGKEVRDVELTNPLTGEWCYLSDDATLMASRNGTDPTLQIWNLRTGRIVNELDVLNILGDANFEVWADCAFSPDNSRAVLRFRVDKEMVSLLWDLEEQRLARKLVLEIPRITGTRIAWIDNDRFVHSTHDQEIHLYDRDGTLLQHWRDDANQYGKVAVSPDAKRLACNMGSFSDGYDLPFIQIRDIDDGKPLSTHFVLPTESEDDLPVSMSPTGHWTGSKELEDIFHYVVETDDGQRLVLTPQEFQDQFGWQNEPEWVPSK